jgi:hypothetical protein
MWESFFGFKKTPFSDSPDAKQLFASQTWNQVKSRLDFLARLVRISEGHSFQSAGWPGQPFHECYLRAN